MSDPVLAALIAATATVITSLLQLKASLAREIAARAQSSAGRRRNRTTFVLAALALAATGAGGFALARWMGEREAHAQKELQQELRARIADLQQTVDALGKTREEMRPVLEFELLRRQGETGASVSATVDRCRSLTLPVLTDDTLDAPAGCPEAEASRIELCVSVPASATVTSVELHAGPAETAASQAEQLVVPGEDIGGGRFDAAHRERLEGELKYVCQTYTHWSSESGRSVRALVRYTP